MRYQIRYGHETRPFVVTPFDEIAAVMPGDALRANLTASRTSRSNVVRMFGARAAPDTESAEKSLFPAKDRKHFEKAGWYFVEATSKVRRAAHEGRSTGGADAREIYLGPGGRTLIGTPSIVLQFGDPQITLPQATQQLLRDGLRVDRSLSEIGPGTYLTHPQPPGNTLEKVVELQDTAQGKYVFVEPVFIEAIGQRYRPSDPGYAQQWQYRNTGANGGLAGADVHAEAAWDITRGGATPGGLDRAARIAVIDNGIHVRHRDLASGLFAGGFFEDDGAGASTFVRRDSGMTFPTGNHGTFCSGMAAARADNKHDGCGMAPECELIPIACLNDTIGSQLTLALAVIYAALPHLVDTTAVAADGADVISCSLGPNGDPFPISSTLRQAIERVTREGRGNVGTAIFWATDNTFIAVNQDQVCSHADVIAVGRSNRMDQDDGSAFGPELAFLAPGRAVYSTTGASGFASSTGCSYSAPLAAGIAALMIAQHPTLTPAQIRQRLSQTCDRIGPHPYVAGRNNFCGTGRVNAEAVLGLPPP